MDDLDDYHPIADRFLSGVGIRSADYERHMIQHANSSPVKSWKRVWLVPDSTSRLCLSSDRDAKAALPYLDLDSQYCFTPSSLSLAGDMVDTRLRIAREGGVLTLIACRQVVG